MKVIVSSVFQVVCFPLKDSLMTIDQMSFNNSISYASSRSSILVIDHSHPTTENVGLLTRIFHLLWTTRCSNGLNGSDPEQIEDRG